MPVELTRAQFVEQVSNFEELANDLHADVTDDAGTIDALLRAGKLGAAEKHYTAMLLRLGKTIEVNERLLQLVRGRIETARKSAKSKSR